MQQLHHFRSNTCRHGAELSTCLCVNVCMSGGAAHSQRVRPFRPISLPHTHLTSSVNVLVCLKSNTCYTTSFTCSCVKCTRTHIHTRPRKQQRVNWRSLLNPWTFYFLVSSLFQPSSWKSGIFCYHDNRSWWRQWIRSSALCWGRGSCIGSGVEDCSWGVWLLKGIGVMLECCMCVFSVCMCVCGY